MIISRFFTICELYGRQQRLAFSYDGKTCKPKTWTVQNDWAQETVKTVSHVFPFFSSSFFFKSQSTLPPDNVRVRQGDFWRNEVGGAAFRDSAATAVTYWRCVKKKTKKNKYSCANPHQPFSHPHKTLMGHESFIRQTSKKAPSGRLESDFHPAYWLDLEVRRRLRVVGSHHSSWTQWTGHRVMLSVPLV